ncbi:hypothetical protein AOQ84DRAFT_373735 [Glonium stellatum]|uniref:Uncharacterized protein n=1 Tax=Glonium stellatum TaxID=574774 RepID=A0A8E2JW56_9PEZI|nr:hypothetical protein AOQ84DRAFT_373735 [Glonium stellatum]
MAQAWFLLIPECLMFCARPNLRRTPPVEGIPRNVIGSADMETRLKETELGSAGMETLLEEIGLYSVGVETRLKEIELHSVDMETRFKEIELGSADMEMRAKEKRDEDSLRLRRLPGYHPLKRKISAGQG